MRGGVRGGVTNPATVRGSNPLEEAFLTWSLSVGNYGFLVMKLPVSRNVTLTLADLPKLFQKSFKNVGFTH